MQKKKILSSLVALGLLAGMGSILTGCGATKIDVFADVSLTYSGYEGYGTVSLSEGDWLEEIEDEVDEDLDYEDLSDIYDAIEFSCEPEEGLSNGDTVTVTVKAKDSVMEKYNLKLSEESQTFTVSGLEEIEEYDPFENVTVTFSGYAPNGTAKIENVSSSSDFSLTYELDQDSGLSNGDTVTVTVTTNWQDGLEDYCLTKGKTLTQTEKTYTVEGLAAYATSISEIPEETKSKMASQAQDVIASNISSQWDSENGEIFNGADFLGYYFLTTKEGCESNSIQNQIYLVYQINADWTGHEGEGVELGYYYYVCFENVLILDDGTCSVDLSNYICTSSSDSTVELAIWDSGWGFASTANEPGYTSKDSLFSDCVASKVDEYTYENTVE